MKRIFIGMLIFILLSTPVQAMEITVPEAPGSAQEYMPQEPDSFWEGVWYIVRNALADARPYVSEGAKICLSLIAITLLLSLLRSMGDGTKKIVNIAGIVAMSVRLLQSVHGMINMGSRVVSEMCEYGKVLIPAMTTALAAQGGVTASAALCAGTVLFSSVLAGLIAKLLVPLLYIYLCLCIACSAFGESILQRMRDLCKGIVQWGLKVVLYLFTGYMSITGVISGTADASALKVTKLAISSVVPIVGGVLSDASESILVSAGLMKNAVGIYGMLAVLSVMIGPFLRVGIQHLLLKGTAAVCGIFGEKETAGLIGDFSVSMGMVLGMIGTMCLLLIIGTVCFMKGIG